MRPTSTLAAMSLFLALCGSATAAPKALNLCFEDVPQTPWTMPDGSGLNIELLKRVEKLLGESFVFTSKPWARCIKEVREGSMDGVLGAVATEERRTFGVFPSLPDGKPDARRALYEDRFNVFMRIGGAASWDGKELRVPDTGVLVQRGYATAALLRQRGFVAQEGTASGPDAIRQLAAGMFDIAIIQGVEPGRYLGSNPEMAEKVVAAKIPYELLPCFLFIGRQTYEGDAKRIEAIWNAIATVRKSGEYRAMEASALR